MTQAVLFATPDSDIAPVTQDAIVGLNLGQRDYEQEKLRGKIAELRCCEQIARLGWHYTMMGNGHSGYDIIAERENTALQRIQVKHGFLRPPPSGRKGAPFYKICNHKSGKIYGPAAYDFLVFYMYDRDQWLVYHRTEIGSRHDVIWIPPDLRRGLARPGSVPQRNPNNWELLNEMAASLSCQ